MRIKQTNALVLGFVVVACARQVPDEPVSLNVLTAPPVCDSVPPERPGRPAIIPFRKVPAPPVGTLVGAVSEAQRGIAIPNARLDIQKVDEGTAWRTFVADSVGGFAFDTSAPGTYRLKVLAIGYRFAERNVQVRAGAIDTIAVILQYYVCSGY